MAASALSFLARAARALLVVAGAIPFFLFPIDGYAKIGRPDDDAHLAALSARGVLAVLVARDVFSDFTV